MKAFGYRLKAEVVLVVSNSKSENKCSKDCMRMVFKLPGELSIQHEGISLKRNSEASTVLGGGGCWGSEIKKVLSMMMKLISTIKKYIQNLFMMGKWLYSIPTHDKYSLRHGFEQN